ncbi:hypothetical protein [Novosphingobium sp. BW1]|uniref:hypothetical protein n=1 Tax=Novosphingobium sp. BW1 TaxID=2592621 RepID=UPI0011DE5E86|nr:hypothetical protein [Novosphingobium sp. BW1]TYC90856.1 hypothetical protein FMM79_06275 [Novosphingobium sp. BW1]
MSTGRVRQGAAALFILGAMMGGAGMARATPAQPRHAGEEYPLRAVRGGSWISTPFRNRVSWRGRDPVDQVTWIFGLRVARDIEGDIR